MRINPNEYAKLFLKTHGKEQAKRISSQVLQSAISGLGNTDMVINSKKNIEFWTQINNIVNKQ